MATNDDVIPAGGIVVFESRQPPGSSGQIKDVCSRFCLIVTGHARLKCNGRQYLLGPDTLCHIPAQQVHSQETSPNALVLSYVLRYRVEALPTAISSQLMAPGVLPIDLRTANTNQSGIVRSILQEMLFEQNAGWEGWRIILQSRLMDLAVRTIRLVPGRSRRELPVFETGNDSIDRVARYAVKLKSRFFCQETLPEAARSVGLSTRQFTELFRKVSGQSWREYVQGLRLRHAAGLLCESDRSVGAVAFESGFTDLSHFHHFFKQAYGCSPLAYRQQHRFALPSKLRLASEASDSKVATPRFRFRGMKGWWWTPEQYLEEIPVLSDLQMNFLMDCKALPKEWSRPMNEAQKRASQKVITACHQKGINFCFGQQPHFAVSHLFDEIKGKNFEAFYQPYHWAQQQGVKWFSLCLDGTSWGSAGPAAGGATHAATVNAIFDRLHAEDPESQFLFCPVACWGDGTNQEHRAYLESLGRDLYPDVFIFWTGDGVVTPRITRVAAESYKRIVKHRLFLWDNYPVNDGAPTLHLGPVSGRDPDLCEVIEGYLSNSMFPQNQSNRLPLATCADYAFNPSGYKPARSIGQAILRFAKSAAQKEVLKQLVQSYPGFIVAGGGTGFNPVREGYGNALATSAKAARTFLRRIEDISSGLGKHFPNLFHDARQTLLNDLKWMTQAASEQFPEKSFGAVDKLPPDRPGKSNPADETIK
jgi:AraC-like DNA-binding protein